MKMIQWKYLEDELKSLKCNTEEPKEVTRMKKSKSAIWTPCLAQRGLLRVGGEIGKLKDDIIIMIITIVNNDIV